MEYRLEEIATYSNQKIETDKINYDNYISTENMLPNRLGVIKATTLPNQRKVCYYNENNILISNIRPYFKKIWFANCEGGCSNDVLNIMVNDKKIVLPKYLYYILFQDDFFDYVMAGNKGTKMPRGDKKHIMNYIVNVPDIEIQTKIVTILENIDKKIELNNQINDNLYEIIKVQYHKFMNELTEYDLVKLKNIANIGSGKRPRVKGNKYEIPVVGASGVMSYTDSDNFDEDIIIIGRVGTLGIVQRYFDKIWASDNTLTIKTEFKNLIENYLKTVDYISLNRGSTQPLITQTDISNLDVKFNKDKFEKFEKSISKIRKKIYQNELQNKTLEQLRDTLIPKLMNGEIDLDKIEI